MLPSHCSRQPGFPLEARVRASCHRSRIELSQAEQSETKAIVSAGSQRKAGTRRLVEIRAAQIEPTLRTTQLAALLAQFTGAVRAIPRTIRAHRRFHRNDRALWARARRSFRHHRKQWSVFHSATQPCLEGLRAWRPEDCCSSNPPWPARRPDVATPPGIFRGR